MSEFTINSIIISIHSIITMMNPKLSFHFEKIESVSSCFKNLSVFSNLFISAFVFSTFFLKNFLYRISGYDSKDIYSSYLEGKEYNILFTIIILAVFNLNFPTRNSRGKDSIYKSAAIGPQTYKLMLELAKSFQYYFFFDKFYELHTDLLRNTERNILNYPLSSINTLVSYFIMDYYFCNFSSTTASLINILVDPISRSSNLNMLKQKSFVFTFVFITFYFVRFRQIHLHLFAWLEIKVFDELDKSLFFLLTFWIIQLEKLLKRTPKK